MSCPSCVQSPFSYSKQKWLSLQTQPFAGASMGLPLFPAISTPWYRAHHPVIGSTRQPNGLVLRKLSVVCFLPSISVFFSCGILDLSDSFVWATPIFQTNRVNAIRGRPIEIRRGLSQTNQIFFILSLAEFLYYF